VSAARVLERVSATEIDRAVGRLDEAPQLGVVAGELSPDRVSMYAPQWTTHDAGSSSQHVFAGMRGATAGESDDEQPAVERIALAPCRTRQPPTGIEDSIAAPAAAVVAFTIGQSRV